MLDIFWGHFGSKSQGSGWTKMVSWAGAGRLYVLDTRSSPIINFRSGECSMDKESGIFIFISKCLKSAVQKTYKSGPRQIPK